MIIIQRSLEEATDGELEPATRRNLPFFGSVIQIIIITIIIIIIIIIIVIIIITGRSYRAFGGKGASRVSL